MFDKINQCFLLLQDSLSIKIADFIRYKCPYIINKLKKNKTFFCRGLLKFNSFLRFLKLKLSLIGSYEH